ncbi:hypothetical protein [Streptantibioticus ferralitis]|uniref:Uncharacterized protein n=1 Tax=Streptantibioticus ferralitis TaxID=236510 RepID=A0ABT5YTE2_9ACTN|nr:hypothetical protein [Streptantibioticus ferralitis]MDF2254876.1 hypothetical protein [Streptantibioticus ferralitis]
MLSDIEASRPLAHTLGQQLLTRLQPRGSVASTADDMRLPTREADTEVVTVAFETGRQWLERSESDPHTYLSERKRFGAVVVAAQHCSGGTALTSEEPAQFDEEYIALLNRRHREPAPGTRHICVLFHAFPTPDPTEAS